MYSDPRELSRLRVASTVNFDMIGFDEVTVVPEPGTLALTEAPRLGLYCDSRCTP